MIGGQTGAQGFKGLVFVLGEFLTQPLQVMGLLCSRIEDEPKTKLEKIQTTRAKPKDRAQITSHLLLHKASDIGALGREIALKNSILFVGQRGRHCGATPRSSKLTTEERAEDTITTKRLVRGAVATGGRGGGATGGMEGEMT